MPDLRRSMKLSICLGLAGALLLPVFYEIYANISTSIGLFLVLCWALFSGVKFSGLTFREAALGMTCTIAYGGILGFVCYLVIHPAAMAVLVRRSVYFQLGLEAQLVYVVWCFFISWAMYLVWLIRFGAGKTIEKFRSNREKAGEYIENAFSDGED